MRRCRRIFCVYVLFYIFVILWVACGGGVGEALAGRRQRGKGRIEKREGNPRFAAAATLQGIVELCMRRLGEEVGIGW